MISAGGKYRFSPQGATQPITIHPVPVQRYKVRDVPPAWYRPASGPDFDPGGGHAT